MRGLTGFMCVRLGTSGEGPLWTGKIKFWLHWRQIYLNLLSCLQVFLLPVTKFVLNMCLSHNPLSWVCNYWLYL